MSNRVVYTIRDLRNSFSISKTFVYRAMQEGKFPKQVRLGARRVGWLASSVDAWLAARVEA